MRSEPILASRTAPVAAAPQVERRPSILVALAVGLGLATALAWALPSGRYTTGAIVEIGSTDPAVRLALARSARDAVLAKPVLSRAATALIAAGDAAPAPALTERLAVTAGLGGSRATGRDARLAEILPSLVTAGPGAILGTIDIVATDARAETAALMATSVAEAFVADQDDRAVEARRRRDGEIDERIRTASSAVTQARARFLGLGGVSVDPAQALAAATSAAIAAQKRVDLIHTIIAAGSPPISDRKDVPDSIASAQRTYLDLLGQLTRSR